MREATIISALLLACAGPGVAMLPRSCFALSTAAPPSLEELIARAASVRERRAFGSALPELTDAYSFPSTYHSVEVDGKRGFCNWLLPGGVMLGQYPGESPVHGPSAAEAAAHFAMCTSERARISTWVCLQTEVPAQDDDSGWPQGGVFLAPELRKRFPGPFTRYGPLAEAATPRELWPPEFVHAPIVDLSTPDTPALRALLGRLLDALEERNSLRCRRRDRTRTQSCSGCEQCPREALYIHCWGGRGRAGLVGCALLSLLWPHAEADDILRLVQGAYDTRAGAARMPVALQSSPQTMGQRTFVRDFTDQVRATVGG